MTSRQQTTKNLLKIYNRLHHTTVGKINQNSDTYYENFNTVKKRQSLIKYVIKELGLKKVKNKYNENTYIVSNAYQPLCEGVNPNYMIDQLNDMENKVIIYKTDNKLKGFIIYQHKQTKNEKYFYIDLICSFKGGGKVLIKHLIDKARNNNINTIKLSSLISPFSFYKNKLNFKINKNVVNKQKQISNNNLKISLENFTAKQKQLGTNNDTLKAIMQKRINVQQLHDNKKKISRGKLKKHLKEKRTDLKKILHSLESKVKKRESLTKKHKLKNNLSKYGFTNNQIDTNGMPMYLPLKSLNTVRNNKQRNIEKQKQMNLNSK